MRDAEAMATCRLPLVRGNAVPREILLQASFEQPVARCWRLMPVAR